MSVTPVTFKVRFPEFDSVDNSRIQLFLDDATLILNEDFWDEKYDLGISYLTAHELYLGTQSEAGVTEATSSIASQAVDGTSISFNSAVIDTQSEAYYLSTVYGQKYLWLLRTLGSGAMTV